MLLVLSKKAKRLLRFLPQHSSHTTYLLVFSKYEDAGCAQCVQHPVRASEAMAILQQFRSRLPTPLPSAHHEGHYCTYLELQIVQKQKLLEPDEGLPTGCHGRCEQCPSYCFMSATEKERHMHVMPSCTTGDTKRDPTTVRIRRLWLVLHDYVST